MIHKQNHKKYFYIFNLNEESRHCQIKKTMKISLYENFQSQSQTKFLILVLAPVYRKALSPLFVKNQVITRIDKILKEHCDKY